MNPFFTACLDKTTRNSHSSPVFVHGDVVTRASGCYGVWICSHISRRTIPSGFWCSSSGTPQTARHDASSMPSGSNDDDTDVQDVKAQSAVDFPVPPGIWGDCNDDDDDTTTANGRELNKRRRRLKCVCLSVRLFESNCLCVFLCVGQCVCVMVGGFDVTVCFMPFCF